MTHPNKQTPDLLVPEFASPIAEDHDAYHHYLIPFLLIFLFAIIETLGGFWTGSLALLSDAAHMFSDVAALGLAWVAGILATKPNAKRHASGVSYVEIFVSIINAVAMLVISIYVVVEAVDRFRNPHAVQGGGVILLASIGFVVNLIVAKQLHQQASSHGASLNNRAAFLHVLGDLAGSAAAIIAGVVIYYTGWMPIDPILSILISLLILVPTIKLIGDIWRTLHQHEALKLGHHHDHDDDHNHDHAH